MGTDDVPPLKEDSQGLHRAKPEGGWDQLCPQTGMAPALGSADSCISKDRLRLNCSLHVSFSTCSRTLRYGLVGFFLALKMEPMLPSPVQLQAFTESLGGIPFVKCGRGTLPTEVWCLLTPLAAQDSS